MQPLNRTWIAGPVLGSILGMVMVFLVIYFRRQKQRVDILAVEAAKDMKDEEDDSGDSSQGISRLHPNTVELGELDNTEVHELAAVEPVGLELNTPRDAIMDPMEEWPLPLSPLPLLFAMTELRDERAGNDHSPKHDTYSITILEWIVNHIVSILDRGIHMTPGNTNRPTMKDGHHTTPNSNPYHSTLRRMHSRAVDHKHHRYSKNTRRPKCPQFPKIA
jgi:hypothetical protein